MELKLLYANIVILAKSHNPSIASKEWLYQKAILKEPPIKFTHIPVLSFVETANFIFTVDTNRLQLNIKIMSADNIKDLPKIVKDYINALPETPYTAIGFNFTYEIGTPTKNLQTIFSPNGINFKKILSSEYQIGGIVNFKHEDFAVTLTLTQQGDTINAQFNFHLDCENIEGIKKILSAYSKHLESTKDILRGIFNGK